LRCDGPGLLDGRFQAEAEEEDEAQEQRYNEELRTNESECLLFFFLFFFRLLLKNISAVTSHFLVALCIVGSKAPSSFDHLSKKA